MRIEDKRKVIEVLLCVPQPGCIVCDAAEGVGYPRYGRECKMANLERGVVNDDLIRFYEPGDEWFDATCIEAAYRLIESSPTLIREWFGKAGAK